MHLFFMKFVPSDWTQDTRKLSIEARGGWIDIICALWNSETRGNLSLSIDGWAGILNLPADRTTQILKELKNMKIGSVTFRNSNVTISCRRILREESSRLSNVEKQRRYRGRLGYQNVTSKLPTELDVRCQKLETTSIPLPGNGESSLPAPGQHQASTGSGDHDNPAKIRKDSDHPVHRIVRGWKKLIGMPADDKTWDNEHFARCCKPAKHLLDTFGQDYDMTAECIVSVYENLAEKKGLMVTLETIAKHAHEWRESHG